jgi:hypothetical protein
MQAPFGPRDLLRADQFVRYCTDRGILTDRDQLEFYDKHDLIVPAVRISHGYVPQRRILIPDGGKLEWRFIFASDLATFSPREVDPHTYYDFDTISTRPPDWVARYEEIGRLIYPSRQTFLPRSVPLLLRGDDYPTSLEDLGEQHEDFYARNQCFALREVQSRMVVEVRDQTLLMDDESWVKAGRNLRSGIEGSLGYIQESVLSHHRFMALMNAIHDMLGEMYAEAGLTFEASLDQEPRGEENVDGLPPAEFQRKAKQETKKEARRDARDSIRLYERETAPTQMRKVIAECGYSIEDVRRERQRAAHLASECDPTYRWTEFTERVPTDLVQEARGDYALALEYYRIVNELEWVLRMLGDKPPTLKKLLVGFDSAGRCLVCGQSFQRKRRTWVTCGSATCVQAHENDLKRLQRRLP